MNKHKNKKHNSNTLINSVAILKLKCAIQQLEINNLKEDLEKITNCNPKNLILMK